MREKLKEVIERNLGGEANVSLALEYEDCFDLEDIENRKIMLNDEITTEAIERLTYHIIRYNGIDKDTPVEGRKPIRIYINSPGGSVTDGFGIIDAIRLSKTPVYTINLGICYSMGFLIFIAGHKRYSMPSATFLCHDGFSMAVDSLNKLADRMDFETKQMEEHIQNYVLEQTNIDKKLYQKKKRVEWYFYPIEAKKLGVVTDIVGTDCDIDAIT